MSLSFVVDDSYSAGSLLRKKKRVNTIIHQKVEVTKIDILNTRKINDRSGQSYEAVSIRAEGNLVRTGTVKGLEFREPVKFQVEFPTVLKVETK
jgi:hypothetical protein